MGVSCSAVKDKEPFEAQAKTAKEVYAEEMKAYRERLGGQTAAAGASDDNASQSE